MKLTLTISDRDLGITLRCLMDAENYLRHNIHDDDGRFPHFLKMKQDRAKRIRAIRKDIAAQRKAQKFPAFDYQPEQISEENRKAKRACSLQFASIRNPGK